MQWNSFSATVLQATDRTYLRLLMAKGVLSLSWFMCTPLPWLTRILIRDSIQWGENSRRIGFYPVILGVETERELELCWITQTLQKPQMTMTRCNCRLLTIAHYDMLRHLSSIGRIRCNRKCRPELKGPNFKNAAGKPRNEEELLIRKGMYGMKERRGYNDIWECLLNVVYKLSWIGQYWFNWMNWT